MRERISQPGSWSVL